MNCPKATIITYDGAFLSAYGQLSFYAGAPHSVRPINKRVKTLLEGYLPVLEFSFDRDGLHYAFESFATPIDLDPKNDLVTFIKVTVSNLGATAQTGVFGANFGAIDSKINEDPSYGWFDGQRKSLKDALQAQRSTEWNSKPFMNESVFNSGRSQIQFLGGNVVQGSHLVFTAPPGGEIQGMPSYPSPDKEAALEYSLHLAPRETKTFEFKMPAVPVELDRSGPITDIERANPGAYRAKTIRFWKSQISKADRFWVDDPKVIDTFRTSLVNDLISREFNPPDQVYQRVNKIQYNYMWIRDSSFFTRTYDMLGLPDIARDTLKPFVVRKDGKVVSFFKPGSPQPAGARLSVQDDYWGQVLWAVGAHYRTTDDKAFLKEIYPLLADHIQLFVNKCKQDPRGLWPVAGPYDNEAINGHYTGHSFWALLGLKYAVLMAKGMNRPDDAARWQKIHDDYKANFMTQLRSLAAKAEGYIPPGMDNVSDGNDWSNASGGLYPFEVLSPADPLAKSTLEMVRNFNYREGIMTYGGNAWVAKNLAKEGKESPDGTLHHYETFYVTESNTILGRQKRVIEDLYSILAHTGSTNSGFEFGIPAWGSRDPNDNFTPHGWFASRYMSQIRDLLVREQGTEIHLASALAPAWVKPGKTVRVNEAPTFFGDVSYSLHCLPDGATLDLKNRWKLGQAPSSIVFHVPWFLTASHASADGQPIAVHDGQIWLPSNAKRVQVSWTWRQTPPIGFKEAVKIYLEKYYHPETRKDPDFLFPSEP
jgi:hypothetical protein